MTEKVNIFQQLKDELSKSLPIDGTKLELEAANNPDLFGRWSIKYSNFKRDIIQVDAKVKRLKKNKLDYYSGRSDIPSLDHYERSEMKTVLSGDEELLKLESQMTYLLLLQDFCSNAMDAIKSRGFAIKNMIEIRQFEAGAK